ncbi:hypothetical protein MPTK1_2g16940 [Marchantia polymorpha subsp. ruderalis]|uniref:Major facilitator superfamily (MFS) profile domain-containing protein n=1 Tax=Marchantia polymorpha TaxID=3197 RepID=A0A2R6WCM5_MARPO|nr:hypothetical protein MARPO_0109s0035 [Marchantia polymorpha]BBN02647.1 hypothetical protein Mp_2g16940 [Marchantia polymorpha subsp. ruderalis]|eukprot:PTQ31605.1 hypothetical protein MARPO_0109s0035 [Marchantia polymorpha]
MADLEQPLLHPKPVKVYPKCPGCKVAHLVVDGAPPAYKELSFVAIMMLSNALPISFLYPFLYFMVKDMHIAKRDEDIGFYAGYIGSAFMIGRFLTSMHWGIVADKYGRKPVMICGVLSVIVFNIIYGFSESFWAAFLSRLLLGGFNGILGPVKAYASEICSDEHQPLGVSVVGTTLGLGMIVGPALGGYLSQPALKYPALFPPGSLFDRYPYLMPCLFVSGLAAVGLVITVLYLPETLHIHNDEDAIIDGQAYNEKAKLLEAEEETEEEVEKKRVEKAEDSIWAVFKNRHLVSAVLVYCTWSMHNMAYTEIFSLWAVSPLKNGGLGFSTTDVGNVLAISGAGCLLFQLLAFPPIAKILGPIATTRYSAFLALPLLCIFPFLADLHGTLLWSLLIFAAVSKSALAVATLSGSFLLINNSVFPKQRGRANGLSVSAVSFFKAVGPGAGGAIFAWAQSRVSNILPGNQMVFFILGTVVVADIILTYEPFLPKSVDKPKHDDSEFVATAAVASSQK